MKKGMPGFGIGVVVFIAGFVVMALELTGSRVLAPYLGSSTFVWTSLIGIILFSLSVGYWWGGRIADRKPRAEVLASILFAAAIFVAIIPPFSFWFLDRLHHAVLDIRVASIVAAFILFTPASVLLGMVPPYAIRLALTDIEKAGSVAGRLSALSTVGSIFGTFAAGFYLISFMGTLRILFVLSLLLLLASFVCWWGGRHVRRGVVLLMVLGLYGGTGSFYALAAKKGFIDIDTTYHRIWIIDGQEAETMRPLRFLSTDPFTAQGVIYRDAPNELYSNYLKLYQASTASFHRAVEKILVIGGGVIAYPRSFLERYPEATATVVEIDPGMTEVAKKHFALKENARLKIVHEDARIYLNRGKEQYDIIFIDAFKSSAYVPFHLATHEAITKQREMLAGDGMVVANVFSAVQGPSGRFLRGLYHTYKKEFKYVDCFFAGESRDPAIPGNLILIATNSAELNEKIVTSAEAVLAEGRIDVRIEKDVHTYSDDFAPVEHYISPAIREFTEMRRRGVKAKGKQVI